MGSGMSTPEEAAGPAVPGGVDANLGPFDEGLQNPPAYRGRTYRTALLVGLGVLALIVLALVIAALT